MQRITICGRLGRGAAVREMQDGGKVISFTVAVNGRYRGVEKTSWYEVSTFNYDRYKNMVQYLTKGSSVLVGGELDADLDEGKDGVTRCRRSVTADFIEFNSNGSTSGSTTETATTTTTSKKKAEVPDDDDIEMTSPKKKTTKKAEPVAEEPEEEVNEENGDELPF